MIYRRMIKALSFFLCLTVVVSQKKDGDICTDSTNQVGQCMLKEYCDTIQEYERKGIRATVCGHSFFGVLICCPNDVLTERPATEPAPLFNNPAYNQPPPERTKGRVCERKCAEYSSDVVETFEIIAPLPNPISLSVSAAKCKYTGVGLVVGGEKTSLGEFPHMAAIGWVSGAVGGYDFHCGGSLISPKFVLSAAHCTWNPTTQNEIPEIVRLGDQNIDPTVDDQATPEDIAIKHIHKHPQYKSPAKYNDIAIFELARNVKFRDHIRPACLWTKPGFGGNKEAIATGWGVTNVATKELAKELQKVPIPLLDDEVCRRAYSVTNRHWKGYVSNQLCAGELKGGKDTCQGDSGSPLQVATSENQCIFHIMGIVSFGKQCAEKNQPAIYTRVSSHLDWIESIVWPGQ